MKPMPVQVVDMDLSADTGATSKPTYNDIVVVGSAKSPPPVGFNTAKRCSNVSTVADDFGDGTDVYAAAEALFAKGVSELQIVVGERKEVTGESAADGDTLENTPVYRDPSTVTVYDDSSAEIDFGISVEDPVPSPSNDPALLNFETGMLKRTGSGGTIDYEYIDWQQLRRAIPTGADVIDVSGENFGRAGVGDLDEIDQWCQINDAVVTAAHLNGGTFSSDEDALDSFHDTFSYVPSAHIFPIAHKSGDPVGSVVAGQLGVNQPWFDPFWDGDGYSINTDFYARELIGDPSTSGTFEGGDGEQMGTGNVIVNVGGTLVLSNSLTTAGISSNYRYLDVKRTEIFLSSEARDELRSLRLSKDQIPYTPTGRNEILGAIRDRLQQYVGGQGEPLSKLKVTAPKISAISDSDKANRVFPDIQIEGTLAGNVHTFGVKLSIKV